MNKIVLPPFNAMLHSEYNLGRIVALSQRRASIDADQTDFINDSLDALSTNALDQLDSDSGLSKISKLHFKADGFKYCYNLNNATFNLDSVIHNWPNTPPQRISEINPTTQQFTEFIDERAKKMYNTIMKIHKGAFVKEQTRRLMCYMAAEGSNALANLTDSRLVHEIDRVAYFSSFLPAIVPPTLPVSIPTPDSINDPKERKRYRHLRKDGSKRKYDLAYLIMAHGNMSRIQSIETLVDEKESLPLMKAVKDFIAKREQAVNDFIKSQKLSIDAWDDADVAGNVFMAATPFEVSWGHGSIMWSQMNGFWELLDLADWKHIINLSSQDYPLRASREIARILNQPKFDGFNFLDTGLLILHWQKDYCHSSPPEEKASDNSEFSHESAWDDVATFSQDGNT
ncbi:hypothetical protein BCR33DRAFT_793396 [Rhizoclosmatium globosum]|uniref:protein xylosyltransferase n=1 Tax=Rhizoclosmatium globosum TaxID=329046 RepID=A0A1Y2B0U8_9FUNG|nr:hypothetical protein BCR33DRAFT_793396 [Rhizoclosmatium globosum]|eukprot:ORY28364.1 hypothetical protein BCR33DRAFT_793396 [Rhizoclosmatium globosum]